MKSMRIIFILLSSFIFSCQLPAMESPKERALQELKILFNKGYRVFKDLTKNGEDINAQTADGLTALMLAARDGHFEIAELLIAAGADINAQDNSGATALILAARKAGVEAMRVLIDAGANINAQDNKGMTALMYAVDDRWPGNFVKATRVLLEKGADFRIQNSKGQTALDLARKYGSNKQIMDLLERSKEKVL